MEKQSSLRDDMSSDDDLEDVVVVREQAPAPSQSAKEEEPEQQGRQGSVSLLSRLSSVSSSFSNDDQTKEGQEPSKEKPQQQRRRSLLARLGGGLCNEEVDIADAGIRSQLSRLNGLMKLDMNKDRQRKRFMDQVRELVQKNPKLALYRFKVDGLEEPLLHQVICRRPPLDLVELVYAYNPAAAMEKGFGDYTILHTACLCHNTKEVIEFLVKQDPLNLQARRPFPPLFCAIDNETHMEVLEFLVKSYPAALCSCDLSSVTPLDVALMEQMPLPIIQLFVSHYPSPELKVSERAGCVQMHPEVSSIFASEHHIIRTLDATNMRFTRPGWTTFFKLVACNETLTELLLDLGEAEVDPDACDALNKMMRENDSLTKVSISGRLLPTAFAKAVISGFSKNQVMTELSFLVHLDFMNIEGLVRNCASHPTLTKLTLRHCVADGTDWSGLSSLTSLERLDLSDCMVGPSLAEPLAALIEKTDRLEELNVARNRIGDKGTVLIAKALEKNSSLQGVDFGQNNIEETGWQAFVSTLQECNSSLLSLGFAMDDAHYDTYNQQVLYYCDQNAMGRSKLSPRNEEENYPPTKLNRLTNSQKAS